MTNKSKLITKLFGNIKITDNYSDIHWKVQDSSEESILFYHFRNKSNDELIQFETRIKNSSFKLCFTNYEKAEMADNIIALNDNDLIEVKNYLLDVFYPIKDDLVFLGVTGTNGKTTVVDLLRQMAIQTGINILSVGTLGVFYNEEKIKDFALTTPDYIDLRKLIHTYQDKTTVLAMELSSIALVQKRIGTLLFDKIAWTNFSQDHLDYHKSMDNYFKAKMLIFDCLRDFGMVCIPACQKELVAKIKRRDKVILTSSEIEVENLFFKLEHNKQNLSLAMELYSSIGSIDKLNLEKLKAPLGRANTYRFKEGLIVIDFAHTPDGIESITKAIKENFKDRKLTTLFGCGGDRDKTKRPLMAKAAEKYSDRVIVTSDNPRFEDPKKIISDICNGLRNEAQIIESRKDAIEVAIEKLEGNILLIAGKGHEPYLDIKGEKKPYSDLLWVEELINAKS